ncbi:MAG: hypothetical protein B7Y58_05505 [Halothiobacillus sp. 35-54-62]|nr:MAG: hypothetical protein B7Y58_05505 [Halothiobacillus sp. 35-54-62]
MNVGMQIDLIGWFALIAILVAVQGLSGQQASGRAPWPKAAVGLLIVAMGLMLGSVLWTSDGSNTLLAVIMILLGMAAAPLSARRSSRHHAMSEHTEIKPEGGQDSILSGLSLITIGGGVSVALLGLTGWVETDHEAYTWDLRLIAVVSLFIGVWTFAAGLMLWLRLNDYLPKSTPTRTQQRVVIAVFILALGLGAGGARGDLSRLCERFNGRDGAARTGAGCVIGFGHCPNPRNARSGAAFGPDRRGHRHARLCADKPFFTRAGRLNCRRRHTLFARAGRFLSKGTSKNRHEHVRVQGAAQ